MRPQFALVLNPRADKSDGMALAADRFPREYRPLDTLPATASGLAVVIAGALTIFAYTLGPQSSHMALHIATMNVAAPFLAAALAPRLASAIGHPRILWAASAAQIVLLWAWHVPSLQQAAMASHGLQIVMQATLLISALVFWTAIIVIPEKKRWQAIAALLITGKLACLLSALMIFSPRVLYQTAGHAGLHLDDQQLAGLLMITACPLSYLVAAVVIAARMIGRIGEAPKPLSATRRVTS